VRYRVNPPYTWFQYCHCSRCRKTTGSAHNANICVASDQVEWLAGEDLLGRYQHPEAKSFSTCWCTHCGSNLPWTTKNGKWVLVPAGNLNDDPCIRPERNIFFASGAPWYEPSSALPAFDTVPGRD
jgi:hypothetical protein